MRRIIVTLLFGGILGGCYPETERFCDKRAECWVDTDENKWDRKYEYVQICYDALKVEPARLRAQNKPDCDEAADALEDYYNCLTGVDCPRSTDWDDTRDVWCQPELRRRTDSLSCKIFPDDTLWHSTKKEHRKLPPALVREWW